MSYIKYNCLGFVQQQHTELQTLKCVFQLKVPNTNNNEKQMNI